MKKQSYYLKHKVKAIVALTVLILVVLMHSLAGKQRVNELQHSVASIYNDRLIPATYIFEITDHMYQKKLLQEHPEASRVRNSEYAKHNLAIAQLVKGYDETYLTSEEKQHWQYFKNELHAYNNFEVVNTAGKLHPAQERHFHQALSSLHQLASIQAGEGRRLNKASETILKGNDTIADMELFILLALGVCVVVLITLPEKMVVQDNTAFSVN